MTETDEIINGKSPLIMENVFILLENMHNVKSFRETSNEKLKTVKYRIETVSNRTPLIWARNIN